jgi:hypothetical protein
MKLIPYGKNQTLLIIEPRQFEVFFSYQTPVCAIIDNHFYVTNEKHSQTTTRHINKYLDGVKAQEKSQSFFDNLV